MVGGTVRFYNRESRIGSITPHDGGEDVFVHATALQRAGVLHLSEGQEVNYEAMLDDRTGKLAVGVLEVLLPNHEAANQVLAPSDSADPNAGKQQRPTNPDIVEPEYPPATTPRSHRSET